MASRRALRRHGFELQSTNELLDPNSASEVALAVRSRRKEGDAAPLARCPLHLSTLASPRRARRSVEERSSKIRSLASITFLFLTTSPKIARPGRDKVAV